MVKDSLKELVENIDYDDLKDLRKIATHKLSLVRHRDRLYFRIYLPKEFVINFERARDWAFSRGLIKKKTRWAFAKFAVMNVIDQIMKEIDKEQLNAAQSRSSEPLFVPERDGEVRQD
jgi:hypothetical protein